MTEKECKSCIGTIKLLRDLAFNIHGVMDKIDADNCEKMIDFFENGLSKMCQKHYKQGLKDAKKPPMQIFNPD